MYKGPTAEKDVQVYTSVRRIRDNHEEVILDDDTNIMDKIHYISAELSETSNNQDFPDNFEPIYDDDNFGMLLRKVKT